MRLVLAIFSALALLVPQAPAAASPIMVVICGSGLRMALPARSPTPGKQGDDDCCKKGCHAANDRKKRVAGQAGVADEDEGCC